MRGNMLQIRNRHLEKERSWRNLTLPEELTTRPITAMPCRSRLKNIDQL
jgi:hypothetical protein